MELDLSWSNFVAVVLLLGTCILVFERSHRQKHRALPPGHMGWPLIGNTLPFLRAYKSQNPESFLNNLKRRYGETGIYKSNLFSNPSIIVCSPELSRKVLADYDHFRSGYNISSLLFGDKAIDVFSDLGHKGFRRLTTGGINDRESLSTYVASIEKIVISTLEKLSKINQPIDLLLETKIIGLKVMMVVYLGFVSDDSVAEAFLKYYDDLFLGLFSPPINIPGFAFHRAVKARRELVKMIRAMQTDERREKDVNNNNPNTKKGLIDLIKEVEYEEGEKLDDEHVVNVLLIFLLAGYEPVGRAATWAIIYLHQNPQMLQTAKEEQEEILKRRQISSQEGLTLSEISQMKYLSKVIDETLRMRVNTFAFPREAIKDTELNGYFIPKGWKVWAFQSAIHLDPEIYSNPKDFLPSRWDDLERKAGIFQPFGAGSRSCPGSNLAKLEIYTFLHYFLLNYKLEQLNAEGPFIYLPSPDSADNCRVKIIKLH